jgi:PAS domain S-box-containing protein
MSLDDVALKVIHIDDDPNLQYFLKLSFNDIDPLIDLVQCSDGEEALEYIDDTVDCIITDYKMPNLDGLELAKVVRENFDIPIIIFTGQGSESVASRAFSIGVNSYIQKSLEHSVYEILLKEVRNHCERYSSVKKLTQSENKYRTFLEKSLDGIAFIVGAELRFVNERAATVLGYSREELTGMKISQLTTPKYARLMYERAIRRQRGEKVPEQYESMLLHKDGSEILVEIHAGLVEFEGEVGSLTVIRDVTEKKKYQERLEYLSSYCSSLNTIKSLDELYQKTYKILDKALGYKVLDIIAVKEGYLEDVKPNSEGEEKFRTPLDGPGVTVRAVKTGETQLVNDTRLDEDYVSGKSTPGMLSEIAVPVFVKDEVFLVLNVESEKANAFNVDDKKLLEIFAQNVGSTIERLRHLETIFKQSRKIESSERKTRFLIENAPYITIILDLAGIIKYVNSMFTTLLGYGKEEIIGQKYNKLPTLQQNDIDKILRYMARLREGKVPEPFVMNFITKDGGYIRLEIFICVYNDGLGEQEICVMARELDEDIAFESYVSNIQDLQIQEQVYETTIISDEF